MTELFIDNKRAVLPENFSFKLTRENVFFTRSGSYTYDIDLPAKANFHIFGHINRLDASEVESFNARVMIDNCEWFSGTATITSVTPGNIKVQLLGGNARMNFVNNNEKRYIDELDLGNWGEIEGGFYYFGSGEGRTYSLFYSNIWLDYKSRASASIDEAQLWLKGKLCGTGGKWVAFPVYNETSQTMCNDWVMRIIDGTSRVEPRMSIPEEYTDGSTKQVGNGKPQVKFAMQPYLLFVVEQVFQALGHKINIDVLRGVEWFTRLFVVNANDRIELCRALPHWTVNEFITQLENFFGVVFVTADGENISLIPRSQYHNGGTYYIKDVLDEWSFDCDEEENVGHSNVGYSTTGAYESVDDELRELVKRKQYTSMAELTAEYSSMTSEVTSPEFCKKYKGYILEADDRYFITKEHYLKEVDYLRPRITNHDNKDIDIELKIVPCPMRESGVDYVTTSKKDGVDIDTVTMSLDVLLPSRPDSVECSFTQLADGDDRIEDVDAAIAGDEALPEKNSNDILYVAINDGELQNYPQAYTHPLSMTIPLYLSPRKESLSLNPIDGLTTLHSEVIDKEPQIDKSRKYCIKFLAKHLLSLDRVFVIRNRRFVCERLEYSVNSRGVEKVVTGYFFEFNE